MCHLTVSGAPGTVQVDLFTFGFLESHSAIIHRTVRWVTGLSGVPVGATAKKRNGQLQRSPANVNSARTVRAESEQR
jgi:hypothetical protein